MMRRIHHVCGGLLIAFFCLSLPSTALAEPDVVVLDVEAPERLYFGFPHTIGATIANIGTSEALGFDYRVVLSTTRFITLHDPTIYEGGPISLAPSAEFNLSVEVEITENVPPGWYYVGLILDPTGELSETNVHNNVLAADHRSLLHDPAPNLVVSEVQSESRGAAGETTRVVFEIENRGNLEADFEYGIYISRNELISSHDELLFLGMTHLAPDESIRESEHVLLPEALPPGEYYLGVIADPFEELVEPDVSGNAGRAEHPIETQEAALRLATSWVPEALVGESYSWGLVAMGGTGEYVYSIADGALPPGIELDSAHAEIHGVAEEEGEWPFVLEVRSGGLSAFSGYVLRVVRRQITLALDVDTLLPAIQNTPYEMRLAAVGGQPPYTWSAEGLPPGILVDPEGKLHGETSAQGSFSVNICVLDNQESRSCRDLLLRVVEAGLFAILNSRLPQGMVGQFYLPVAMETVGETGQVTWSLVDGRLPPGISLSAGSGIISGTPSATGRYVFRLRARDEAGFSDTTSLSIDVDAMRLTIIGDDNSTAKVGEHFEQTFEVPSIEGREPFNWSILSGLLPSGLLLDETTGTIEGIPDAGSEGTYTFGIRVQDAAGAEGMSAHVLRVISDETSQALQEDPVQSVGCKSVGGSEWMAASLLLALLTLALAGSRRRPVFGLILAVLLVPAEAWSSEWVYSAVKTPSPYEELSEVMALDAINGTWDGNTRIDLPFPVVFYGETYEELSVSVNGIVGFEPFTGSHHSNRSIPSTSLPTGMVAPWWDDLDARPAGAEIGTATLGEAPTRVFVVQWKNVARGSGSQLSFQIRLYEGQSSITVHYGSFTGTQTSSASAGIENQDGTSGIMGLSCTPSCSQEDFPSGQRIVYSTMANLVASNVRAPGTMFSGVPTEIDGTVANLGGEESGPFDVAAVMAASPALILDGVEVGRASLLQGLGPGASQSISVIVEIPDTLEAGQEHWLSLIPNPDGEVPDAGGGMNAAEPVAVRIGEPLPNLRVTSLEVGDEAVEPGENLEVTYEISNTGNLAVLTSYWIVLSPNEVISLQDLLLHEDSLMLPSHDSLWRSTSVSIPESISTGRYYVGIILDPDGEIPGPDISGYSMASSQPIAVVVDQIEIMTQSLPSGRVGRPYSTFLRAAGSHDSYRWRLSGGELPPGLTLSEDGWIEGWPRLPDDATASEPPWSFSFQVLVRSGDHLPATNTYVIMIDEDSMPLTMITETLPGAAVGFDYRHQLLAAGGERPYGWSLHAGLTPPPGLGLSEDGRLLGVPSEPGTYDLIIEVTGADGASESSNIELEVYPSGHFRITTTGVPPALLGEPYETSIEAVGGTEPYTWEIGGTEQLPRGLVLNPNGTIEGVPEEIGVFDIFIKVVDDEQLEKESSFSLAVGFAQGMAIATERLPRATFGEPYEASLSVTGGEPPFLWRVAGGSLPEGLSLDENEGVIHGLAADDGVHRDIPFILEVQDSTRRTAVRALSIGVGPAPPVLELEGCSASPGGNKSAAALLLISALWLARSLWRKAAGRALPYGRRTPKSRLHPAAAVSLLLLFVGASCAGDPNPCKEVACTVGTYCSEIDGKCRCGGPGGELCSSEQVCDPVSGRCHGPTGLCDGVSCENGLTCDPDDGTCKCGGSGGRTCEQHERCDSIMGSCVEPDPCIDVDCVGEETCDPATGHCRCGDGFPCTAGYRCEEGQCVANLCYGVACPNGMQCDPADGECLCGGSGGEICADGEICDSDVGECVTAGSCMGVVCPAGTSCDPDDGICKCGGIGGVICEPEEFCSPIDAECVGAELCRGVICEAGMTCDPTDGVCRCGGHGGVVCETDEVCLDFEGLEPLCSSPCSPIDQDCTSGLGCYYHVEEEYSFCMLAGFAREGDLCTEPWDCAPGMHCHLEQTARYCRRLCDPDTAQHEPGSCGSGSYCGASFELGTELGICIAS